MSINKGSEVDTSDPLFFIIFISIKNKLFTNRIIEEFIEY